MKQIFFPACGFGFWYLLGVYIRNQKRLRKCIISGSSGGAFICICALLPTKYRNYKTIMRIAKSIDAQQSTNLYTIVSVFIDKLIELIDCNANDLQRIRIRVTKIISSYPFISRQQITPASLSELREACIASAYIPLLSNYNNHLYYSIGDSKYIDCGIIDWADNTVKVPLRFIGLQIPTEQECKTMYNEGLWVSTI